MTYFFDWFANLKHHFELIELIQSMLLLCETGVVGCCSSVYCLCMHAKRPSLRQYGLGVEQEFGRCRTFNSSKFAAPGATRIILHHFTLFWSRTFDAPGRL